MPYQCKWWLNLAYPVLKTHHGWRIYHQHRVTIPSLTGFSALSPGSHCRLGPLFECPLQAWWTDYPLHCNSLVQTGEFNSVPMALPSFSWRVPILLSFPPKLCRPPCWGGHFRYGLCTSFWSADQHELPLQLSADRIPAWAGMRFSTMRSFPDPFLQNCCLCNCFHFVFL